MSAHDDAWQVLSVDDDEPQAIELDAIPLVFADATDVIEISVNDTAALIARLEHEWTRDRALQLLLIVLDSDSDPEIRADAATAADDLLRVDSSTRRLTCERFFRLIPASCDLQASFQIANDAGAQEVTELLGTVANAQQEINAIAAWFHELPEVTPEFGTFPIKEIGHGAMAVVYESVKDEGVVAIKWMSKEALRDPAIRKRFDQEANVSLRLNHPNIVRVYDYGEIAGVPFMLMERLYGEPLKASIDEHKRFAPRDVARIAMQIADALDYMHLSHVYHRDLKPGNIMLVDDGHTAKIMDFGIAVTPDTDRQTKTGMIIGTPQYMSPDRLAGYEATQRGDLYALGLILYEMLTGQYAAEPMARIAKDHPRPSAIVPDLPQPLDAIVAKLLARDPSDSYESARQLLGDLKTLFLAGA